MTSEFPLKVYVNDDYRENFLKSTKLKNNHYHIKTAQEIINEIIKEERKIIIK